MRAFIESSSDKLEIWFITKCLLNFSFHLRTGGKTVLFFQEASKDQTQSLLICRRVPYPKRKAVLSCGVIYKSMTQLDSHGRTCPQEFLMYESKNKCCPRSKRFLLHRLDSFGRGIRCLLYLLYTRHSV